MAKFDIDFYFIERIVLSKREISARTKFGPAEGVVKVLTKDELNKYRKSRSGYPLMFLSQKSCLDVSNEGKSYSITVCK